MLAPVLRQPLQQIASEQIDVFGEVLRDDINLALWQRQLPAQISDFANALLAQGEPLGQSIVLELASPESEPNLSGLVDALEAAGHLSEAKPLLESRLRTARELRMADAEKKIADLLASLPFEE